VLFEYTRSTRSVHNGQSSSFDILAGRGHFPEREQPHRPKDAFLYRCPFHLDSNPSFSLHEDRMRWKCWAGCGQGGPGELLQRFGDGYVAPVRPAPKPKKVKSKSSSFSGCALHQLSEAKGLPIQYLRSLGWHDTNYCGRTVVAIPWPGGTHYRINLDGKPKYLWKKGSKVSILGIDRLEEIRRGGWVLVAEGETDFAAGRLMGLPVVAIPGASTWQNEWTLQFQGCHIYVWKEPGPGGESMVRSLAKAFWMVNVIEAPAGIKDLVDLRDQSGAGAVDFFNDLKLLAQEVYCDREGQPRPLVAFDQKIVPADKSLDQTRVECHPKENVPEIVQQGDLVLSEGHFQRGSQLWEHAKQLFPMGRRKPYTTSALLGSKTDSRQVWVDFYGTTWRWYPNAQHHRALIYFNLLPRINGYPLYKRCIPVDDWSPKVDGSLTKRIRRRIQKLGDPKLGWCRFDNKLKRSYYIYLTNVPGLPGFELVEDVELLLIDVLTAIDPPSSAQEDRSHFHPYGGSQNWTTRLESTREEDRDKWEVLATNKKPTDFGSIEAECIVSETAYEYVKPYWRGQYERGLETRFPMEESVKVAVHQGGQLTKRGRAVLAQGQDGSDSGDAPGEGFEDFQRDVARAREEWLVSDAEVLLI
jgi:hypothetical protein